MIEMRLSWIMPMVLGGMFYVIPIGIIVLLCTIGYRYFFVKRKNKKILGTFLDIEMLMRQIAIVGLIAVGVVLVAMVIGIVFSFGGPVSHM